jgi:tetratricopeptide (TPR) repeat protein
MVAPLKRKSAPNIPLEGLRQSLATRPCALLIGAGSSIACGFPSWGVFIDRLAQACAERLHPDYLRDLRDLDYLIRADAYLQHLGDDVRAIFRDEFSQDAASHDPPEWLRILFGLRVNLYITTNYTAELEVAAQTITPALSVMRWFDTEKTAETLRSATDRKSLIYLHGRWDDSPYIEVDAQGRRRSSIILGEHSYKYAYEHPGDVRSLLTTVARTHTVIVVGSSLTDQDTLSSFRTLDSIAHTEGHSHYAILPRPSREVLQAQTTLLQKRYSITPLYYGVPGNARRDVINEGLKDVLASLVSAPRRPARRRSAPSSPTSGERPPSPRFVHPLHRAEDFEARPTYELALRRFVARPKGGVLALCGIGGSGKTALVRELLDTIAGKRVRARLSGLFVWSFYEDPSARAFLASLAEYLTQRPAELFVVEQDAYEAVRVHGGRNGRVLVVMDGLERVQISRRDDRSIHGALTSTVLRRLLLWIAQQGGGVRAIVTTRFPLPELESEKADQRFVMLNVDSLSRVEARALLRRRGIRGDDRHLDLLLDRFGTHALTVSHLGGLVTNYLASDARRYRELGVRPLSKFSLGDTAMRLSKLMATYGGYLAESEPNVHAVLVRVAIFSRPVGLGLLTEVFLSDRNRHTPGPMQGMTTVELQHALDRLVSLRFLYIDETHSEPLFAPHPVIREILLEQLQDVRKGVANDARDVLEEHVAHLVRKPGAFQMGMQTLDLLEELIYFCVDAGQSRHAFEIYSERMGSYGRLSTAVDGVDRGERVLTYMLQAGELFINGVNDRRRVWLELELALYLRARGRLRESLALFAKFSSPEAWSGEPETVSMAALNAAVAAYWRGDFARMHTESLHALDAAGQKGNALETRDALAYAFIGSISAGNLAEVRGLVTSCNGLGVNPLGLFRGGLRGFLYVGLLLRTGFVSAAISMTDAAIRRYTLESYTKQFLRYQLLSAEGMRAKGDASSALATVDSILPAVVRCGQEDIRLSAHATRARCLAEAGRHDEAIQEIEEGRRLASSCEFDAIGVELITLQADIQRGRGNTRQADELLRKAAQTETGAAGCSWAPAEGTRAYRRDAEVRIVACVQEIQGCRPDAEEKTELPS